MIAFDSLMLCTNFLLTLKINVMKQKLILLVCAIFSIALLTSCGSNSGEPQDVLSKKVYTQVINKYDVVRDFVDGLSVVRLDYKYGAIDTDGEEVIPVTLRSLNNAVEEMLIAENEDGKCGAYNIDGELVIPLKFDGLEDFAFGLSRAKLDGKDGYKYGYINKNGEEIVPIIYDSAQDSFTEEMAWIATDEPNSWSSKYGFVNINGEIVIPQSFAGAHGFSCGLAMVRTKNGYGFIDKEGILVTRGDYDSAEDFSDGVALVEKDDKCSVIDVDGNTMFEIPSGLEFDSEYADGLLRVFNKKTRLYAFLGKDGKEVIPFTYYAADVFQNGQALVAELGEDGIVYKLIDTDGDEVAVLTEDEKIDYDVIHYSDFREGEQLLKMLVDKETVKRVKEGIKDAKELYDDVKELYDDFDE